MNTISNMIQNREWRSSAPLTRVDIGRRLLLVSDYAGEHKASAFYSFSFLLVDAMFIWYWDEARRDRRKGLLRDNRSLSYKKLQSDGQRRIALVPFLRASNSLPGLLVTFLVDKRIESLFGEDPKQADDVPAIVDRGHWNPDAFEKLLRVVHLGSLVLSGMASEGQDILWITDRDAMVPNDARHIEACKLLERVASAYINRPMGRMQFATTRSDDGSMEIEDLAAIPDLAAGALAEVATWMCNEGLTRSPGIMRSMHPSIPAKARAIAAWYADSGYTLKKIGIVIDHLPPDRLSAKYLDMEPDRVMPEYDFARDLMKRVL